MRVHVDGDKVVEIEHSCKSLGSGASRPRAASSANYITDDSRPQYMPPSDCAPNPGNQDKNSETTLDGGQVLSKTSQQADELIHLAGRENRRRLLHEATHGGHRTIAQAR